MLILLKNLRTRLKGIYPPDLGRIDQEGSFNEVNIEVTAN